MEYEIYDYSMAASGYAQFSSNGNNDLFLLNNNVNSNSNQLHEIYMGRQKNGGSVKVDVSGHSTSHISGYSSGSASASASAGKENVASKKKNQTKHSTTKLSVDPQSVAARHRRHRISKRFRILQTLVPGGTKMDTASMLDEAIQYVKFLKYQIWLHEMMGYALSNPNPNPNLNNNNNSNCNSLGAATLLNGEGFMPFVHSSAGYNPPTTYMSPNWGNLQ